MKRKFIIIPAMLLAVLLFLQGCTPSDNNAPAPAGAEPAAAETDSGELILTLEELAQYNGENGNPAYIAVDGVIYDVTDAGPWRGGKHNGFSAGNDLTEEIKTISPHGISKLTLGSRRSESWPTKGVPLCMYFSDGSISV